MVHLAEDFFEVRRKYTSATDYALRQVVIMDGAPHGRYIGQGEYIADFESSDGVIFYEVSLYIHKDRDDEEQVVLGPEVEEYTGIVSDEVLKKLRFKIHFARD